MLPLSNSKLLQAEKLNTYRFCDNVWTFMLKEVLPASFNSFVSCAVISHVMLMAGISLSDFDLQVEFRENSELAKVDRVKIVACDAKSSVPARTDD